MIRISVIIPVYNGEIFVAQCIENILCQSYKDIESREASQIYLSLSETHPILSKDVEIIVVDDGSTDRSADIAAAYPVKLVKQKNSGVAAARNTGIEAATGDYIHFMDVDDWINLDFYRQLALVAAQTDADMVFAGMIHEAYPAIGRIYTRSWLVSAPEDKFAVTGAAKDGYSVRYIVKRSLLGKTGIRFDKELTHSEDLVFTARAVGASDKIATAPGALYYYRNRAGSAMRARDKTAKRRRKESEIAARAMRDEVLKQYGLTDIPTGITAREKTKYKLLGLPLLEKRLLDNGKTRWYLFGLYVAQSKQRIAQTSQL